MPAGRPLKFQTPEIMQELIDAYFDSCWETGKDGNKIQARPYTITGLASALDTDRITLIRYEDKEKFSNTIKRAKQKCEQYAEERLFGGQQVAGAIFNLKNNYGYKDTLDIDVDGELSLTNKTDQELEAEALRLAGLAGDES